MFDAGSDAGPACSRASDCDDGIYCNGTERCEPGSSGAAANGCASGSPPCVTNETCDEDLRLCASTECPSDPALRDQDGDGHESYSCAGDDCDDSDPDRYTGNAETCAGGSDTHDEDCDPVTLASSPDPTTTPPRSSDGDGDGDGHISSSCCNGDDCGDDCDDAHENIHPGAPELCNATDDDCDEMIDGDSAYCPVGVCGDRRCRGLGWERVFGSAVAGGSVLNIGGIAVDGDGNTYILLNGDADLDDDGSPDGSGEHVVSISAEGRHRWHTNVPAGSHGAGHGLVGGGPAIIVMGNPITWLSPDDGSVLRSTAVEAPDGSTWAPSSAAWVDNSLFVFGSLGTLLAYKGVLVRYDADGVERARRLLEVTDSDRVGVDSGDASVAGIVIRGSTSAPLDLGGGVMVHDTFIAHLDLDFGTDWAISTSVDPGWVAGVSDSGEIALLGNFSGAFEPFWATSPLTAGDDSTFIAVLDPDGSYRWHRVHDGPGGDYFTDGSFDGRGGVMVSGTYTGTFWRLPGVGGNISCDDNGDTFFAVFDAADGSVRDARSYSGSGLQDGQAAATDTFGNLVLGGRFDNEITLPNGTTYTIPNSTDRNAWALRIADID